MKFLLFKKSKVKSMMNRLYILIYYTEENATENANEISLGNSTFQDDWIKIYDGPVVFL